ncbi:hypothetical protein ACIOG7_36105 [Streptomyces sp. NPDC087894]|uniref:hypothetical protein n=1 Tax=Streptomyces sp. NPDC087894 TaxID=3365816 RepID=UPI003818B449
MSQYARRSLGDDEVDARFFAVVTDLVGTPTELVAAESNTAWRMPLHVPGSRVEHLGHRLHTASLG